MNILFYFRDFYTGKDAHVIWDNFLKTSQKTDSRQLFLVSKESNNKEKLKITRKIFFYHFLFVNIMYRFKSQNLGVYKSILVDHSRVILVNTHSDYINASFIDVSI